MASELKVDKFTGVTTAGSILVTGEGNSTTTNLQQGLAKSWSSLNQDSSGHPVYDSKNVASTTDEGTGETTITFTNNMGNANYAIAGAAQSENESSAGFHVIGKDSSDPMTTSKYRTDVRDDGGSNRDTLYVSSSIHGDLA